MVATSVVMGCVEPREPQLATNWFYLKSSPDALEMWEDPPTMEESRGLGYNGRTLKMLGIAIAVLGGAGGGLDRAAPVAPPAKVQSLADLTGSVGIKVGLPAPEFSVKSLNGETRFDLASRKDRKAVILVFLNSWSVASHVTLRGLIKGYPRFATRGVEVVSVCLPWGGENSQKALKFAKQYRVPWVMGFDEDLALVSRYGVLSVPTVCVIGRNGRVLEVQARTMNEDQVNRAFELAVTHAAAPISPASPVERRPVSVSLRGSPGR